MTFRSPISGGAGPATNGWATHATNPTPPATDASPRPTPIPPHFAPTSSVARFVGAGGTATTAGAGRGMPPAMSFMSGVRAGAPSAVPPAARPSFSFGTTAAAPSLLNTQRIPPSANSSLPSSSSSASTMTSSSGASIVTSYAVGPTSTTSFSFAPSPVPRPTPASAGASSPVTPAPQARRVIPASRPVSANDAAPAAPTNVPPPQPPHHHQQHQQHQQQQWDPNSFAPENLPRSNPIRAPPQHHGAHPGPSFAASAPPDYLQQQHMEEDEDFIPFASQEPAEMRQTAHPPQPQPQKILFGRSDLAPVHPPPPQSTSEAARPLHPQQQREQEASSHRVEPVVQAEAALPQEPFVEQPPNERDLMNTEGSVGIHTGDGQSHQQSAAVMAQHAPAAASILHQPSSELIQASVMDEDPTPVKDNIMPTEPIAAALTAPANGPSQGVSTDVQTSEMEESPKTSTPTASTPPAAAVQIQTTASPTRAPKIALPCPSPLRPQKNSGAEPEELKRFIAEREREISILKEMIAQEKNQTRHFQMEVFEKEKKERELESRLQQMASAVAFKDKEVMEIQQELEKIRKADTAAPNASSTSSTAASSISSSPSKKSTPPATNPAGVDGHLAQVMAEAVNTDNDRLFEFLLEDSIDSLTESQPPDEETLLADGLTSHTGAATFRSLRRKEAGGASGVKPLKLKSAMAANGASASGKSPVKPDEASKKTGGAATSGSSSASGGNKASPKKVRIASPPVPVPAPRASSSGGHKRTGRGGSRNTNADNGSTTPRRSTNSVRDHGDGDAMDDEHQRLQAALAHMKEKWRGVKRAINGEPVIERERSELIRETRQLRFDIRDILREELASFGSTFLASSSIARAEEHPAGDTDADANKPPAKRHRKDDTAPAEPTTEAAASAIIETDQPSASNTTDVERSAVEARVREELEKEIRAEVEKELDRERQKYKTLEEEMKGVKRKTRIVYERYGILKKKKGAIEEQMKRAEKENADLKKANASFVERNDALATRAREAQELAQTAEKRREKAKALKKQIQELVLFKERQTERIASLENEREEARRTAADLEKQLQDAIAERDALSQRTDQLEKHNRELLSRVEFTCSEVAKMKGKLERKKEVVAQLRSKLASAQEKDSVPRPAETSNSDKGKAKAGDDEDEDLDGSPITPTGLTCLTATGTQGDPLAATPGFPLSMPLSTMLPDSQESEDMFADVGKDDDLMRAPGSPQLDDEDDDEDGEDDAQKKDH